MFKRIALHFCALGFLSASGLAAINPNQLPPSFNPSRGALHSIVTTQVESEFLIFDTLTYEAKLVKMSHDVSPSMSPHFQGHRGSVIPRLIQNPEDAIVPTGMSGSPSTRAKSLFGLYPRSPVRNMLNYPERTIGHLGDQCTATLVGPRHALTAAHCVFNFAEKKFGDLLDFVPGKVGHREPYGAFRPRQILIPKSYVEIGDTESDYALLVFNSDIGEELGWVGYGPPKGFDATGKIIGYPTDKSFATPWMSQCPLAFKETTVVHQCDTTQGMSGAAILIRGEFASSDPFLIAIHTHGGVDFNGGKKLDNVLFNLLTMWFEYDYIGAPALSVRDYPLLQPERLSIELKNRCSHAISVEAVIDDNLTRATRRILQPGETQVSYELAEFTTFSINAQTLGASTAHLWSRSVPCSIDDLSCYLPIRLEQMKKIHDKSYRYEFRCSSFWDDGAEELIDI